MLTNAKVCVGIIIMAVILLGVLGFYGEENDSNINNGVGSCVVDSDCVVDSCCHASGCVDVENAPVCDDVACTMSCEPGTMDCGQGSCQCLDGKCEAVSRIEEDS